MAIDSITGMNLLHVASERGDKKMVKFLVHVLDINSQDSSGNTPLHVAVEKNQKWLVTNTLLPHDPDLQIQVRFTENSM